MAAPLRKTPAEGELLNPPRSADPAPYGWRVKRVHLPSGEVVEQQIPLTPEDLLDPQLDDVVPQSGLHFDFLVQLAGLLRSHFEPRKDIFVAGDMKMHWGIPGLKEPAPDIAIIPGVRDRDRDRPSFHVVKEGTRPCLVLEVVSPFYPEIRRNDYEHKVAIYERVGIPEYLIVDPPSERRDRLIVTGYRLGPDGRYHSIEPDDQGRLYSETTDLLFGIDEEGRFPAIVDARTGERLLSSEERADLEKERREAVEAENARLRAELERLKKA